MRAWYVKFKEKHYNWGLNSPGMTCDITTILCMFIYIYIYMLLEEIELHNKKEIYVFENFNSLFLQHDFGLNM